MFLFVGQVLVCLCCVYGGVVIEYVCGVFQFVLFFEYGLLDCVDVFVGYCVFFIFESVIIVLWEQGNMICVLLYDKRSCVFLGDVG